MFVYKHTETKEYIKKQLSFLKKYILHRKRIREFLGLRIRNFHGIISIPTYKEIFNSPLVVSLRYSPEFGVLPFLI